MKRDNMPETKFIEAAETLLGLDVETIADDLQESFDRIDALTAERDRLRDALYGLFAQSTADAVHPEDEEDFEAAVSVARDALVKSRALTAGLDSSPAEGGEA